MDAGEREEECGTGGGGTTNETGKDCEVCRIFGDKMSAGTESGGIGRGIGAAITVGGSSSRGISTCFGSFEVSEG